MGIQRTISPVDGSIYTERELSSPAAIEHTLAKAASAREMWRQTPLSERKAVCERALAYFLAHADEIGLEITWQMGRPIRYTPNEIRKGFADRARYMIDIAGEALADIPASPIDGFQRFIRREPIGVVFVIAPWNYPYLTSVNSVLPAILAGNPVIYKPAQQTPLCADRFAAAFAEAGLPDGVFQHLTLTHAQVAGIIGDNRVSYVAFTGSVEGGRAIQRAIGPRFITAGLELGGKDPAYVRADADVENAIENLVDGAFFNSGQSCCGIERIYVHESVFDRFTEGFKNLTLTYKLGNPLEPDTTLGPLVKPEAAAFARQQVKEAVRKGAKALIDPYYFPEHRDGSAYMAPQVLVDVNHAMSVMTEESFAPLVGIMAVKDDDEAIRLMNDSRYGLSASVWTTDRDAALHIGNRVETGTWFMNRCDYLDPALAWTGIKDTGRGATLSVIGYEALTRPKSYHLKL